MKSVQLARYKHTEGSAVLLDNLTLSLAASFLYDNLNPPRAYPGIADASVLAEASALSTLIDALILYDTLYVPREFTDRWYRLLPELWNRIIAVDISPEEHEAIQVYTKQIALAYINEGHFLRYVRFIQAKNLEGVFLKTVANYHGIYVPWVTECASEMGIDDVDVLLQGNNEISFEASLFESTGAFGPRSCIPAVCMMLLRGASYYETLASMLDVPYSPHPFRAPFCLFNTWAARSEKGVTYSPLRLLSDKRKMTAEQVNSFLNDGLCDIAIPPLLSMVLYQSTHPGEVIQKAIEISEQPGTVEFRKFLYDAIQNLKQGKLDEVQKIVRSIQRKVEEIDRTKPFKVDVTIGLSPSLKFQIPIDIKNLSFGKDRLSFIKSIWSSIAEVASLEQEIGRIWGRSFDSKKAQLDVLWEWLNINPEKIAEEYTTPAD